MDLASQQKIAEHSKLTWRACVCAAASNVVISIVADDPRSVSDAAKAGVAAAIKAGSKAPIVFVSGDVTGAGAEFAKAPLVAALGTFEGCYSTLQTREALGEASAEPVEKVGFVFDGMDATASDAVIAQATAVEEGRRVARDICSGDPERMAPPRAAEYMEAAFAGAKNTTIKVNGDLAAIEGTHPLLAAVCRASRKVPRHHPAIVSVDYTPAGGYDKLVVFVGKGVTYDTGGADIKAGGIMAGMKRDKGGAAAVAGFMRTVATMQPEGTRYVALCGYVRNSVGTECYVADEVITSHAGKRVLVVNTDAEGRMVMADLLSEAREMAKAEVEAGTVAADGVQLHTCATLTGHAVVAMGIYPIALDNWVAAQKHSGLGTARAIQAAAHSVADPFEVSTMRREDIAFVAPRHSSYDVLQCNTAPSSRTPRGHQFPAAFLMMASGLGDHGRSSDIPLAYTHLDIAGAASIGDVASGYETGSPVAGLSAFYLGV
jgi:leucyl aminopeptidase